MSNVENDIYNVWDGEKIQFTLNKIFKILKMPIPVEYIDKKDIPIKELSFNELDSKVLLPNEIYVLFDVWPNIKNKERFIGYTEKGVIIFSPVNYLDKDRRPIEIVHIPNGVEAWYALGRYVKNLFKMPTIGITGTVGKTTTTRFAEMVFGEKFNVFTSGNNRNTAVEIVKQLIRRYSPEFNFHIQEIGGGRSKLVEESVRVVRPDSFAITKINKFHHVDQYKSPDEIVYDKTSFDRYSDENTVGVINFDDDELKAHEFKSNIIKCGIESTDAEYTAKDIKQRGMYLTFNVCYKEKEVPVKIQIVGTHNASNALLVFALAKHYGLTDEEIRKGFLKYKSTGIRQNIKEICGRTMYIDCFNVCADSIYSCIETVNAIEIPEGNRKIAILGGENALGINSNKVSFNTGCNINEDDIDEFIFTGPKEPATDEQRNYYGNGKALYEGAKTAVKKAKISFNDDLFSIAKILKEQTKPGDLILFKGIFRVPLFAAIDLAFGTSFLIYNPNFIKVNVQNSDTGFTGGYASQIDGVNIYSGNVVDGVLTIPETIDNYNVFRIGRRVFANKKSICNVNFGSELKSIGCEAFMNCKCITKLTIPENVIYIEESAFKGCTGLKEVTFEGIGHIESNAFKDCKRLSKVIFKGDSCKTIEIGAFDNCSSRLKFFAEKGSAAEAFAKQNDIKVNN